MSFNCITICRYNSKCNVAPAQERLIDTIIFGSETCLQVIIVCMRSRYMMKTLESCPFIMNFKALVCERVQCCI